MFLSSTCWVFVVYLLAFFNPTVRSLRTIEDFSQTVQVEQHLSIRRICKSTLSDFNQLVDPQRLEPILQALRAQVSRKTAGEPTEGELQTLLKRTVAVDGTFLTAAADVVWAVANSNNHGAVRHRARLDAHVSVSTWLPEALVIPAAGESEAETAAQQVQPGRLYLYDRGYMSYPLLRAHYVESPEGLTAQSSFVVRFKAVGPNSSALQQAEERELTDEDRAAGVVSDRVGCFVTDKSRRVGMDETPLREVVVEYASAGETKTLRLITNLLDVSARTIALLYQQRWQVELFFRWLKSYGNFNHLISHQPDGVLMHFYVTVIALLLMYLHTGYRPSKYMFSLLSQVSVGAATLEEIMPILRERERRNQLARESAARRRVKKKSPGV